jgi:hypothetical protein
MSPNFINNVESKNHSKAERFSLQAISGIPKHFDEKWKA